ncbi:MAG TPA: hypothetical protein VF657_09435 [Actinoplanes sp.]|jgi:hypothetical protein
MAEATQKIERVQLGVRMEARLVKVLKGLAEFNDETLGELLEKIVLHSFEPVPGDEGESCASPHSRAQLKAVEDLKKVYGLDYQTHSARAFPKPPAAG